MPSFTSAGLNIIMEYEGLRLSPYQDSRGVWTIGYGHTKGVTAMSPDVTERQAYDLLMDDVCDACTTVINFTNGKLNNNQFSALVSLIFNEGAAPLKGTLGAKLAQDDYAAAAAQFDVWVYCGKEILPGLVKRRAEEKSLFLSPVSVTI